MPLFANLMGVAHDHLRAKSPIGSAIGDAIGSAIGERNARKSAEQARTASLRQLKLDHLPPAQQRTRILEMADAAGFIREDD